MRGRNTIILTRDRPDGVPRSATETGRNRLLVTATVFTFAFVIIGLRLVEVSLLRGPADRPSAAVPGPAHLPLDRANITDRNGVILATSLPSDSLYANPRIVPDPRRTADRLARILPGTNRAELRRRLTSGRSFVWLKRHLTPDQKYRVNRLGIPGLDFQRGTRRVYPGGRQAAHVLGFTDIDNRGIAGIEQSFEKALGGGGTLALSLDIRVQHVLQTELRRAMRNFRAIGAAGVVADVRTGEIIAMASLPDFDPNRPDPRQNDRLFNRATMGVYEMGSTFKIFTTAMALDAGIVDLDGGYDATQPIHIARFTIRDYHAKKRWLSVPEIFMYSSNIGAAKMALALGGAGQRRFLGKLGILGKSSIELSEIGTPLIPGKWGPINTMTIGFGHGLAVSPLHVVSGVAAVVNGGIMRPPTLIRRNAAAPVAGTRVMHTRTSEKMRRLLRLVVERGTGKRAGAKGYLVGGKTGTAEKPGVKRYRRGALISSFIGAFPMDAPRYVVMAMLDEAHGTKDTFGYATGGWVAAPIVSTVISRMAAMYGLAPVDETSPDVLRSMHVTLPSDQTGERHLASF